MDRQSPRPATKIIATEPDHLTVSGLMKPSTPVWNAEKLQACIHPHDIQIIKRIRPRLTAGPDTPTWIYTKDGQYSVKSGYHQLTKDLSSHLSKVNRINAVTKSIWTLSAPPRIKHFWWKVIHNALPVADALIRRRIKIPAECILCGEDKETISHLFFHCRVAREIWELSPIALPPGQLSSNLSLLDIYYSNSSL